MTKETDSPDLGFDPRTLCPPAPCLGGACHADRPQPAQHFAGSSKLPVISSSHHRVELQSLEWSILCLTSRTTVTSARIPEEDACPIAYSRGRCLSSRVQLVCFLTRSLCVLQRVSLGALSDITVVLGMRQSIVEQNRINLKTLKH